MDIEEVIGVHNRSDKEEEDIMGSQRQHVVVKKVGQVLKVMEIERNLITTL